MTRHVAGDTLREFVARALGAAGMTPANAARMADLMTEADLGGQDGHGVFRLPQYIRRIRAGGMVANPEIAVLQDRPATALIDGGNGPGHLVMSRAAEIAIAKARTTGVAWVGARQSNHAGPAFLYARMPLAEGMIGLYVAVGSANHMPPWGGTDLLLSTNPIAVAIPSNQRPPIVLDMATTVAAYGKVKTAADRGETMPVGWMIDRTGAPLTDPARASEGLLLPIGGPKGYGLSLIFGLLAGTLNGAAFGADVVDFNADSASVTNTGHFLIALDVAAFMDPAQFRAAVDDIWAQMKASNRLPGVTDIRLPGERLAECRAERLATGIPLPAPLLDRLDTLAADLGIAPL
ncbi:Ldh family oxidoreductase [Histidinibacterium lentulum]|uniref:Ldh family oxidoreductase n=1 Tax=Histidinibacterium lentulum TaxID=2480588 RepID=A0A3N2QRJ4_9RHOB|nr:Ldh family oxidoreductase [Histidinibacterium lentulum]ROT97800.1 Ldh family oxidoreductase [Histidinibacterium lentulum]